MGEQNEEPVPPQQAGVTESNREIEEFVKGEAERIKLFLGNPHSRRSLTAGSKFMDFFEIAGKLGITDDDERSYATVLVGNRFMRDKMRQTEEKVRKNEILKDNRVTSKVMEPVIKFLDKLHEEALQGGKVYEERMQIFKISMRKLIGEERTVTIERALHEILTEGLYEEKKQGHVRRYDESTVNLSKEEVDQWANRWRPKLEAAKKAPSIGKDEIELRFIPFSPTKPNKK